MCRLQGIDSQYHSIAVPLTEIGPLLLPEVLNIIGVNVGRSKFYEALLVSLADLWTTINRKQTLIQKEKEVSDQIDCLVAKKLELEAMQLDLQKEIAVIEKKEAGESNAGEVRAQVNKRQKMS